MRQIQRRSDHICPGAQLDYSDEQCIVVGLSQKLCAMPQKARSTLLGDLARGIHAVYPINCYKHIYRVG